MDKEKCIDVLNDLACYIEEEWDVEEHSEEIDLNVAAISYAINILEKSNTCGELFLDGEKYLVSK